jgi:hypothetical protein
MSQTKVTLPITLEYVEIPSNVKPISLRDALERPESAEYCFLPRKGYKYRPFDPWELRRDFLKWPPELWEGFVEMAGSLGTIRISQNGFAEWQAMLREALLRHPREWRDFETRFDRQKVRMLFRPLPIGFVWDGDAPEARIALSGALLIIIATIQLDVLRAAQFRACARTDCRNPPFEVETRRKIFCSPECAHLVAVRRSREPGRKKGGKRGTRTSSWTGSDFGNHLRQATGARHRRKKKRSLPRRLKESLRRRLSSFRS